MTHTILLVTSKYKKLVCVTKIETNVVDYKRSFDVDVNCKVRKE